jgi:uncharacterized membrane protein
MRHFPYGYEHNVFDWLFPILMLALLAGLVVLLVWSLRRPRLSTGDADPLRRAAARYASGDIERVEFERIQRDLTTPPSATTPLGNAALRLARGEITTEEFDAIKTRLENGESSS